MSQVARSLNNEPERANERHKLRMMRADKQRRRGKGRRDAQAQPKYSSGASGVQQASGNATNTFEANVFESRRRGNMSKREQTDKTNIKRTFGKEGVGKCNVPETTDVVGMLAKHLALKRASGASLPAGKDCFTAYFGGAWAGNRASQRSNRHWYVQRGVHPRQQQPWQAGRYSMHNTPRLRMGHRCGQRHRGKMRKHNPLLLASNKTRLATKS